MQENILPSPPEYKLYKKRAISVATFLCGPLAAGYLIAENFKQLGQPGMARKTWLCVIGFTVIIFGALIFLINADKVPNYLVPVIYTAITSALVKRYQGPQINSHEEKSGQFYSAGRVVLVAIIGAAVLFGLIMGVMVLLNPELLP